MGKKELRDRDTWQDYSGDQAGTAELSFYNVFAEAFKDTNLSIRPKPNEFANAYVNIELPRWVLSEIYNPPDAITRHGLKPDYAIDNRNLNKSLYVEVKRQDGWVEGKSRSAGRGNAHERSCKFFTPGLRRLLQAHGRLGDHVLPFWTVFQGDITRDPCRVREIYCWYAEYSAHFFLWRDSRDPRPLQNHFDQHLKHLLLK